MAAFVMVVSGVTAEQLEKLLSIQTKSGNKVRFVPQGNAQANLVASPALTEQNNAPGVQRSYTYNNVRLEWSDDGAHFAREAFDLFLRKDGESTAG